MYHLLLIFLGVLALSFLLTAFLIKYAHANNLMDFPNKRSSHSVPTPRGGGVAISITFFLGLLALTFTNNVTIKLFYSLLGSGILIIIVGFLDDFRRISILWRLLIYFIAAIWGLSALGGMPPIVIVDDPINFSVLGHLTAVFYLVWLLNLYNFMDGIDGVASLETYNSMLGDTFTIYDI